MVGAFLRPAVRVARAASGAATRATSAPTRSLHAQQRSLAAPRAAPRRRWLATPAKPEPPKKKAGKVLTRAEVEALAESAKQQQKLMDAEGRLFGGGIDSYKSPYLWALLAACVMLHYYNADQATEKEAEEALLERLRHARREPQPLTDAQRGEMLAHKRLQLARQRTKGEDAERRAAKLRADIAKLEAGDA